MAGFKNAILHGKGVKLVSNGRKVLFCFLLISYITWNASMLSCCGICHAVLHLPRLKFSKFRNFSILNRVFCCQSSLNINIKLPCTCTECQPAEYLWSSSAAPSFHHPDDVCTELAYRKVILKLKSEKVMLKLTCKQIIFTIVNASSWHFQFL